MSIRQYMEIHKLRRRPSAMVQKKVKRNSVSTHVRYNEFRPREHAHLRLLRAGIPLESSPDDARESLTERHLFYYVCNDDSIDRHNPLTPKFVGVLQVFHKGRLEYVLVHPLDLDLQQIYAEREDVSRAWDTLCDGTPYWIDVYAQRKCKK